MNEDSNFEANHAVRLSEVLDEAVEAFGDEKKAVEWLRSPVRHLRGKTAIEMLATEDGTTLVRESIGATYMAGLAATLAAAVKIGELTSRVLSRTTELGL